MDNLVEDTRLPSDIDAQPLVRAAAEMRPVLRQHHEEIEREQRIPRVLFEQLHAAGFYRMVIPRSLGGLQVDPLTYTRVVELLAEGVGSVGWNIANNSIGQLVTLGLPDEGVQEVHGQGAPSVMAGTAVQGGGQAVPVEGGYRVNGHWTFGSGCMESSWMLGSFQVLDEAGQPRSRPDGGSMYWRGVFRREEATVIPGSWDVAGLRGTGSFDWTVKDVFLPEYRTCPHVGVPLDNQWARWPGLTYALPSQCWVGPHHSSGHHGHRARGGRRVDRPGGREIPTRAQRNVVRIPSGAGRCRPRRRRIERGTLLPKRHDRGNLNTIAGGGGDDARTTRPLPSRLHKRRGLRAPGDGSGVSLGWQHVLQTREPVGQCWRDLHVVGQTVTVGPEWYPIAGRALMGMDPGPRLR